jgi:hypothetical protein
VKAYDKKGTHDGQDDGQDGVIFQQASYGIVREQLKGMLHSRARRLAGYDLHACATALIGATDDELTPLKQRADAEMEQAGA